MENQAEYNIAKAASEPRFLRCENNDCQHILGVIQYHNRTPSLKIITDDCLVVITGDAEITCPECGTVRYWHMSSRHLMDIIERHESRLANHLRELEEIKTK
jgi:hypothetical protein